VRARGAAAAARPKIPTFFASAHLNAPTTFLTFRLCRPRSYSAAAAALGAWACTGPGISGDAVAPPAYFTSAFSAAEVLSWTASGDDPQTPPAAPASSAPQQAAAAAAAAAAADAAPHAAFPDTPAALARLAASPERRAAAAAARERASAAFAVLRRAPPGAPAQAHVIAEFNPAGDADADEEAPATLFTMRTRVDARWAICARARARARATAVVAARALTHPPTPPLFAPQRRGGGARRRAGRPGPHARRGHARRRARLRLARRRGAVRATSHNRFKCPTHTLTRARLPHFSPRAFLPSLCSYAALLEADGHAVGAAAASTEEVFALAASAHAVVVWFGDSAAAGACGAASEGVTDGACAPPLPAELAMLLRDATGSAEE
jgi:hypothetical protein